MRSWIAGAVAGVAMLSTAIAEQVGPRVGAPAPDFAVRDSAGKVVTLAGLKGKTVVLEWTNPECPFVNKHYVGGSMQSLQREARANDIVWLTISSSAPGNAGYLDELEADALVSERKASPTAFLLDRDGRLLKDYAVPVALTMAIITPNGTLAYYGAIDDKPTAKPEDVAGARNYVRAALDALAKGEAVKPAQTRPYGCAAQ